MTVYEIIGGAIVVVVALAIILLTLNQNTKGQGLSGAIMGNGAMGAGRMAHEDAMLEKLTRYAGIILILVTVLACVLSARLS